MSSPVGVTCKPKWAGYDVTIIKIYSTVQRQTDRYFIDRKKVNPDLFVIEIRERYVHVYTTLLIAYDNIHSMTYITKIMLTGMAIRALGTTIIQTTAS